MLIVVSDLHLVESPPPLEGFGSLNRNLEPKAYQNFAERMAYEAILNKATHVELVLAGDIFEMLKSPIWYEDEERPYIHLDKIFPGSTIEAKILRLLDRISEEDHAGETLQILRGLAHYFQVPFRLHYLVGNHDRIVNATSATRRKVRLLLGMPDGDGYLPHTYTYQPDGHPIALIRHGHEYDDSNFSKNLKRVESIPLEITHEVYDAPSLGDFIALEFANKLPYLFLQTYGPQAVRQSEILSTLFLRLTQFDDVRPLTAMLHFLMTAPGISPQEAWKYLEPVFIEAMDLMGENRFFLKELRKSDPAGSGRTRSILRLLYFRPWRKGIPFWFIWRLARFLGKHPHMPESGLFAGREAALAMNGSSVRCVISGHTHSPEVSLIDTRDGMERYHINTGTWRNVVPTSGSHEHFGRIKALAHVALYGPGENQSPAAPDPTWSFDYWAGYSQKFLH